MFSPWSVRFSVRRIEKGRAAMAERSTVNTVRRSYGEGGWCGRAIDREAGPAIDASQTYRKPDYRRTATYAREVRAGEPSQKDHRRIAIGESVWRCDDQCKEGGKSTNMAEKKGIKNLAKVATEAAKKKRRTIDAALEQKDHLAALIKAQEANSSISRAIASIEQSTQIGATMREAVNRMQSFRIDPAILQIESSMKAQQEALRAAMEPLERLNQPLAITEMMRIQTQYGEFAQISKMYQEQFRLPEMGEAARLAAQVQQSMKLHFEPINLYSESLAEAMNAIKSPWLDAADALSSAHSFAALQDIGQSIATLPSFGDELTASLRDYLGDWRTPVALSDAIADDIAVRRALYERRGFDTELTDFPEPAYDEVISIAGLAEPLPEIEEDSEFFVPTPHALDEMGFKRTNAAHDHLLRFEVHLRMFIESRMRAEFGPKWIKQQVPWDMRKSWQEKQDIAEANGEQERPLIAYADFTDYETIIVRNDNWNAVFRSVFRQKTSVAESLRRLYPVRLSTMHARLITPDDELFLKAEVKRILKAIGVM